MDINIQPRGQVAVAGIVGSVDGLAGEMLLLFTDGATDARDPGDALPGEERMLGLAEPGQGASKTVAALRDAAHAHAAGTPPFDDPTLVMVARA